MLHGAGCRTHTQAEGWEFFSVTLTRPVGSGGVIVGTSPCSASIASAWGLDFTTPAFHLPPDLFERSPHPGFRTYIRTIQVTQPTPHYLRDMEPGPSNPPNAGETDRRTTSAQSKMRLHGGNIPTIPQDKLCPHCPAKFTRCATRTPVH